MVEIKSLSINPYALQFYHYFHSYPTPLVYVKKSSAKIPLVYPNRDCTNNLGVKVTCANGILPESKQYSYASVPKDSEIPWDKEKSANFYSVEDKCGESLPADFYTANRIIDLHNQYRSQVSQRFESS